MNYLNVNYNPHTYGQIPQQARDNAPVTTPIFNNVSHNYPMDTVDISKKNETKKEGLSTTSKWLIGAGAAAGVAFGVFSALKGRSAALKKLYSEKIKLVKLAENIEFKEAKSVEEGIKFAKDVLKVGEVGEGFTLDAINYVNKGLVEVSNANKGRLFMPRSIAFDKNCTDRTLAYVDRSISSKNFGRLVINGTLFDNKSLNEMINESYSAIKHYNQLHIKGKCNKNVIDLLNKFEKAPEALNIAEKQELFINLYQIYNKAKSIYRFPLKHLRLLQKNGVTINLDEFSSLSIKDQRVKLYEILDKENIIISIPPLNASRTQTIHHELGHLQDYAKNLKDIHQKKSVFNFWQLDNRWGCTDKEEFKKLFDSNPTKFQKRYPELYEFLTNEKTQETAGEISLYAQTGIGEFIAETYAKMIAGCKLSDDVMALYKKYNGPMLG